MFVIQTFVKRKPKPRNITDVLKVMHAHSRTPPRTLMTNILHSESAFYDVHGGAGLQLGDGGKRIRTSRPSLATHRV